MIKGAIVGFGKIARTNHLAAFQSSELQDTIGISSVVEADNEIREKSRQEYNRINFYESLDMMYKNDKVDFIDIATPPKYHKEIIEWAVDKGIHIICEKPFTISYAAAKELYSNLYNSNVLFKPIHQYKYSPLWQHFKSFIDQLDDTKIFIQFNVFRTGADPGLNTDTTPWRLNKEISGGGILSDTGFHYLYLSNWLLGQPNKVTAINHNLAHNNFQVEDTSQVILEFERGIIQITLSWASNSRKNEAKLISNKGSLHYSGEGYLVKSKNGYDEIIAVPNVSDKSHYTELYINLFSDFVDNIQKKNFNRDDLKEALNTVDLLEKCNESSQAQKTIELTNE